MNFLQIISSYVDPLGSLITVRYTAGAGGYVESRDVQENFVTIRQSSPSGSASSFVAPARPVVAPQPPVQVVAQSSSDSDLVAKIISQLTPFIQQTVSTTLSSSSSRQPVAAAAPIPAAPVQAVRPVQAASSVQGVFGIAGQNNVRVETPNFNFNYDLQK